MHSELLHLGPLTIRAFGLCLALGFIASLWAASRLANQITPRRSSDMLSAVVLWMLAAGVAGARLAYVAEHWRAEFAGPWARGDFLALLRLDQGGLMFYGGLAGATAALAAFARIKRDSFLGLADLIVTVLPLGHAFGRIGCFLHGCCFGRISHSCIGVTFPRYAPAWYEQVEGGLLAESSLRSLPVLPTQLVEALGNLLIFTLLASRYRRWAERPGVAVGVYCLCYAALRFGVEELRGDPRMSVGRLSISQAVSLALAVFGLALLRWVRTRKGRGDVNRPDRPVA